MSDDFLRQKPSPMNLMTFEIIGEISDVETIAVGSKIRDLARLDKFYGKGRWRKLKAWRKFGCAAVEYGLPNCIGMKRMA